MREWMHRIVIGVIAMGTPPVVTCCTPQQAAQGAQDVVVLEQAACQIAADLPQEPAWATFVCAVVGEGGKPVAVRVRVPRAQVAAFARLHPPPPGAKL